MSGSHDTDNLSANVLNISQKKWIVTSWRRFPPFELCIIHWTELLCESLNRNTSISTVWMRSCIGKNKWVVEIVFLLTRVTYTVQLISKEELQNRLDFIWHNKYYLIARNVCRFALVLLSFQRRVGFFLLFYLFLFFFCRRRRRCWFSF